MSVVTTLEPSTRRAYASSRASATASDTFADLHAAFPPVVGDLQVEGLGSAHLGWDEDEVRGLGL